MNNKEPAFVIMDDNLLRVIIYATKRGGDVMVDIAKTDNPIDLSTTTRIDLHDRDGNIIGAMYLDN